jgi:hypothetical protein
VNNYASEAGHWYTEDGQPAYETVGANGQLRKTTLRDARKNNLLPGVSDIIKCASTSQLTRWLVMRGIRTTLSLPPIEGENDEAYVNRVYADCESQGREVMDLGSLIHGCLERHLTGRDYDHTYSRHVMGALATLDNWCGGLDDLHPEKSFAHPLGYGGKCDIHKSGYVADFKSKDFGTGEFPLAYQNHAMQLAAYRHGFKMPHSRCAIIYVSTREPGHSHLVEVSQEELQQGWEMFCALLDYWKAKNKLLPVKKTFVARVVAKATRWVKTHWTRTRN